MASHDTGGKGAGAHNFHLSRQKHNGAVEKAIDLKKIWAIVIKNWMVLKGDKVRMVPLFLMPVVMIIIFGYAAGNLPKHLPVAVADYDQSGFSQALVGQLSQMDSFSIQYIVGTQDEGKRLLDEGKIKVLFIVPQGAGEQAALGEAVQLSLMVDESDSSVAQSAKAAAQNFALTASSAVASSRLGAIEAHSQAAQAQLLSSKSLLEGIASTNAQNELKYGAVAYRGMLGTYSTSSSSIKTSILTLENSLGFLIDQNEVADSYVPGSSSSQAALTALATGDSQSSTLQQIGIYNSMLASNSKLASGGAGLYSSLNSASAKVQSQAASAQVAISLQDAAGQQLEIISSSAKKAGNPISISILEPYGYGRRGIDFLLPSMLALIIFQGASMGLGRAVAGERHDGSLTRVFLTPTSNITIILGTQIFYLLLETVRSMLLIFVAVILFGVTISGNLLDIAFIIMIYALGTTGVGMALSVMSNTQDQYMALAMLISLPMMFLSGAFFPIQTMPKALQSLATVLPVTYAGDALRGVMVKGFTLSQLVPDLAALAVFGIFTLILSLSLFKREVA